MVSSFVTDCSIDPIIVKLPGRLCYANAYGVTEIFRITLPRCVQTVRTKL